MRTQNMNSYKYECISNTIYVYHKSNKHAFKHNEHENHDMLKIINESM